MNIEKTIHGDLIVSFTDVRSPEDRDFANEVSQRWEIAPVFAHASGRLLEVFKGHKFRGEKGQETKAILEDLQGYVDDWASLHLDDGLGEDDSIEPGSDDHNPTHSA